MNFLNVKVEKNEIKKELDKIFFKYTRNNYID